MMRTLKQKIKGWKIMAVTAVIPIFFFVVACQDQAESVQSREVFKTVNDFPANVQQTLAKLKAEFPTDEFIVIPPTGHNVEDFKGHENHISMINGEYVYEANAMTVVMGDKKDGASKYLILQYKASDKLLSKIQSEKDEEIVVSDGEQVFLVVEQPPTYPGGLDKMYEFLNQNTRYPEVAKKQNIQGSVFISFTVEKNGTISEATLIKGISKECDQEALRVVKLMDKWNPGMQSGKAVRVKFVLPVKFKL
jgi:TonB family protein